MIFKKINTHSLGFKLACVIVLKIAFLYGLWLVVLQYQKTRVDTPKMGERLFPTINVEHKDQ